MEVHLLGALRLTGADGTEITPTSEKHRMIIAMLSLRAPAVVTFDALVDALWPDSLPDRPLTALQIQISRLRKLLPPDVLDTTPVGYRLLVREEDVDVLQFRALVVRARASWNDDRDGAIQLLREAELRWTGPLLPDLAGAAWLQADVAELTELRLSSLEQYHESRINDAADSATSVPELERLVVDNPLRERLTELLMLALYRTGRQSDALHRFAALRTRLADELGLLPSRSMRDLEMAIITHDVALTPHRGVRSVPKVSGAAPPHPFSSFVGRDVEIERLIDAVGAHRLVTVVGAGGVGKTRMVTEAFVQLDALRPERAWFISLADVEVEELVATRVAAVVGVDATSESNLVASLVAALHDWACVLVLDNCEAVGGATAALVAALLGGCPDVRVVATSREPLRLQGEESVILTGLPVGGSPQGDAEVLFAERLRSPAGHDRIGEGAAALVTRLCSLVEGWPLAIELIAANVEASELEAAHAELEARILELRTPYRQIPGRHASLQATLDWSYDLLDARLRLVYRWLGVFDGPVRAAAATAVFSASRAADFDVGDLRALAERSLLELTIGEPPARLLRPVTQHARDKLREDEAEYALASAAFVVHFVEVARQADANYEGPQGPHWLERIRAEEPNLVRAIEVATDTRDGGAAAALASHLGYFWMTAGLQPTGLVLVERLLEQTGPDIDWKSRVDLLQTAGYLAGSAGMMRRSKQALELALEVQRAEGDCSRIVTLVNLSNVLEQELLLHECLERLDEADLLIPDYALVVPPERVLAVRWAASVKRSSICIGLGRFDEALSAALTGLSIAHDVGSPHQRTLALYAIALAQIGTGALDEADQALAEAERSSTDLGGYRLGHLRRCQAMVAVGRNKLSLARDLVDEALSLVDEHDMLEVTPCLVWRAEVERRTGDLVAAESTVRAALRLAADHQLGESIVSLLQQAALLLQLRNDVGSASVVLAMMEAITSASGQVVVPLLERSSTAPPTTAAPGTSDVIAMARRTVKLLDEATTASASSC